MRPSRLESRAVNEPGQSAAVLAAMQRVLIIMALLTSRATRPQDGKGEVATVGVRGPADARHSDIIGGHAVTAHIRKENCGEHNVD